MAPCTMMTHSRFNSVPTFCMAQEKQAPLAALQLFLGGLGILRNINHFSGCLSNVSLQDFPFPNLQVEQVAPPWTEVSPQEASQDESHFGMVFAGLGHDFMLEQPFPIPIPR